MRQQKPLEGIAGAASLLCCPNDRASLVAEARALRCPECDYRLCEESGIFLQERAITVRRASSSALRLMQSGAIARIYEDVWRPVLVRAVSRLTYATEDAIVARHLGTSHGKRILDLCCGTCRASRRWIEGGAVVVGIDESPAMLRTARRRCASPALVLLKGNAMRPHAKPGAFDAVVCFAALHLLRDPVTVIANAAPALRPGGTFVAWALAAGGVLRSKFLRQHVAAPLGLHAFDAGGLRERVRNAGLDVVEEIKTGAIEIVVGRRS